MSDHNPTELLAEASELGHSSSYAHEVLRAGGTDALQILVYGPTTNFVSEGDEHVDSSLEG